MSDDPRRVFQTGEIMRGSMWEQWLLAAAGVPDAVIQDLLSRERKGENIASDLNRIYANAVREKARDKMEDVTSFSVDAPREPSTGDPA